MSDKNIRPAVLFDLDGTLLPMDLDEFQKVYFGSICRNFPDFEPQQLVKYIWTGIKAMVMNNGAKSNRDAFAEAFAAAAKVDYYEHEPRFEEYYKNHFHICRSICKLTDTSKAIIETLKAKGYTVAIATNPIFPKIATTQRLEWIGLDIEDFPLVTTFENSNYAKPNLEYYKDVCQRIGVQPQGCVMVGNDVQEDGCAKQLGMDVILIKEYMINKNNEPTDSFTVCDSLEDVLKWAQSLPECQ